MISLKTRINLLVTYLSLSSEGRRFLRKLRRKTNQIDKSYRRKVLSDSQGMQLYFKNLVICDKVFSEYVPESVCKGLGRDRFTIYARFVSYAWFVLGMWTRVLDAFEVAYDLDAKERCVLIAFVHREWNDLFDSQKYSYDVLFKAIASKEAIPEPLILLRQLKQMDMKLAPLKRFGKYYEHMQGFYKCCFFEYTKEKAEVVLNDVAPFVALIFMYMMVPDIPEALKETLKPFSRWMYMVDELADIEDDKKAGRITYVGMAENPQESVWQQYKVCEEAILRNAPGPDKLIEFMKELTTKIIDISKRGINIEESFLSIR